MPLRFACSRILSATRSRSCSGVTSDTEPYQLHREQFLAHYHQRSNVGSTFSAVKRLFGPAVRSTKHTAQINEVLAKVLCYNLRVITRSIYELGVAPRLDLQQN